MFKVDRTKTAFIVIDMQNAFLEPGAVYECLPGREIVANINKLTRACRGAGIPVIWVASKFRSAADWGLIAAFEPYSPVLADGRPPVTQLMDGARGVEVWSEMEVDAEKDHEVVKTRYSAFISGSSNLERLLRTLGRDNLVFAGIVTNVCVGTSAMDAMMLDFKVTVVSDATAAATELQHQATLINLMESFAEVVNTAGILKEIKQTASG